jgi:hypothetical protein
MEDREQRSRSALRTRLSMMGLDWDTDDEALNQVIWDAYLLGRLDGDEAGFSRGYGTARRDYT